MERGRKRSYAAFVKAAETSILVLTAKVDDIQTQQKKRKISNTFTVGCNRRTCTFILSYGPGPDHIQNTKDRD